MWTPKSNLYKQLKKLYETDKPYKNNLKILFAAMYFSCFFSGDDIAND